METGNDPRLPLYVAGEQISAFSQFLCPNQQGVHTEPAVGEANMNGTCKKCHGHPGEEACGGLARWP